MIVDGPSFQPKLVSNNDKYLKDDKRKSEDDTSLGIGNHLYYEAMVSIMNK
jgi:hypothetical protein